MRRGMRFTLFSEAPTSVAWLSPAEKLALSVYRELIAAVVRREAAALETIWNGLSRELGADSARTVMRGLWRSIWRTAATAQRTINYRPTCCRHLAGDELRFLGALSALQQDDVERASTFLTSYLGGCPGGSLIEPLRDVAKAFAVAGRSFPQRNGDSWRTEALLHAADLAVPDTVH